DDLLGPRHQIHGPAHPRHHFPGNHPVGQIAFGVNFQGAQNGIIYMSSANYCEGSSAVETTASRYDSNWLPAGIANIYVNLLGGRNRTNSQKTVFRLQYNIDVLGNVVRHQGRQTYAQVDNVAVFEFPGNPLGNENP